MLEDKLVEIVDKFSGVAEKLSPVVYENALSVVRVECIKDILFGLFWLALAASFLYLRKLASEHPDSEEKDENTSDNMGLFGFVVLFLVWFWYTFLTCGLG